MNTIKHDIKCGLHSGIRVCDITWFCFLSKLDSFVKFDLFKKYYELRQKYFYYDDKGIGRGYIPCPICAILKVKSIKIKHCNCY